MVFKIPHGTSLSGHSSYYDLFTGTSTYNDDGNALTALQSIASYSLAYKSSIVDEWNTKRTISAVSV